MSVLKFIINLFLAPIGYLLSDRAKRLIVLTSLYGNITKQKQVNEATLIKLNKALHLVSTDDHANAMLVPMVLQSLVWGEVVLDLQSIKEDIEARNQLVDTIIDATPRHLRYRDERSDINKLLNELIAA